MARSKLFTGINLIGLAVSMSVGLLIMTFVTDLMSYDSFHKNKDNIFRVLTLDQKANAPSEYLASSSLQTGRSIKETLSQVGDVTVLHNGFNGVASTEDKALPLQAYWADNSFLKMFTYPLLDGDFGSALEDPYSLVLTEKWAEKMFGTADVLGNTLTLDTHIYKVTGVMKDIPKLSHLSFEALISFSTAELQFENPESGFADWDNIYQNYTYILLPPKHDLEALQQNLDQLAQLENSKLKNREITLALQPLTEISIGKSIANEIGPTINNVAIWVLVALALIVIASACFNYTNLSIARALKRSREVGVRKVVGANKGQLITQFMVESIAIALVSLPLAVLLFLFLREEFISLHSYIDHLAVMEVSPKLMIGFVLLAMGIGTFAGLFPAFFFSKIKAYKVLKGASSLRLFKRVNLRKTLVVVQYTFSLIFITTTIIGYAQYRSFVSFDLGFHTENIVNIHLQGHKADILAEKLSKIPAIGEISQSRIVTSLGQNNRMLLKYKDPNDSVSALANRVDEKYLPLHGHEFLSGSNFRATATDEVIVNEKVLKRFNIAKGDPNEAIGERILVDGKHRTITGVLKDFHYERVESAIKPTALTYSAAPGGFINAKVTTKDWPETLAAIESAWKEVDAVRPLEAKLYVDAIERAFSPISMIVKVIGFLSFLAICISSLGLLGMVVFTTETRLREISIRKVLGAAKTNLVYVLGKSYLSLLTIAALIALPITYLLFDKLILVHFAYHKAIAFGELTLGFLGVLLLALVMIGSQTLKAANMDPAQILRDE